VQPGGRGRLSKVVVTGQGGIGVGFDDDDLTCGGQTDVNSAQSADLQHAINLAGQSGELFLKALGKLAGRSIADAPFLAVSIVPFSLKGGEFGFVIGDLVKEYLAWREDVQFKIAHDAQVQFARINI